MDEVTLIKKAKEELTKNGGVAWSGARYNDIFHIFDIIYCAEDGTTGYYQVSTKDHKYARMQKIYRFKEAHKALPPNCFLMLWNYNTHHFEIERIPRL